MKFRFIDQAKTEFPAYRLCKVLSVSQSGYFAWKDRPACRRQQGDLVLLAHAKSSFALSNGTYGSPRMTRALQDIARDWGFAVGRRRPVESAQYWSVDYQATLRRHGTRISMSGKGNCYDNAMVETFFKTLKSELVWRNTFFTRADAERDIAR